MDSSLNYGERQTVHDIEYQRAWKSAPQSFKNAAAKMGLDCEPENRTGMVIGYEENYVESSYKPNMADLLDEHIDYVIEKYGAQHELLIRSIAADLKKPMEDELIKNRSFLLGRVACYLIKEEGPKILPRVHALLHSIPGLAKGAGYGSLRASAVRCKVSAEWLRRRRDKWCHVLSIPIPTESRKSDEARAKYKTNAYGNHWRRQVFTAASKLNYGRIGTNGTNGSHNGTNGYATPGFSH
jgi:hypothetical protein